MIERWPESDRPRERLYWAGPAALADAELLALQLGAGSRGRNAMDVARELRAAYGSLGEIASREATELAQVPGVGVAKAARLAAAVELSRRLRARTPGRRVLLGNPADVYAAFAPLMEDLKHEIFRVALLDTQNALLRDRIVSEGTLSASLVHPREVFKPAIVQSAGAIVVAHNHPSGDTTPSPEDTEFTKRLQRAGELLGIRVLDHVIIADGSFVSLREAGYLER